MPVSDPAVHPRWNDKAEAFVGIMLQEGPTPGRTQAIAAARPPSRTSTVRTITAARHGELGGLTRCSDSSRTSTTPVGSTASCGASHAGGAVERETAVATLRPHELQLHLCDLLAPPKGEMPAAGAA